VSFDRYMLQVGIGTNRKLRRLPVAQRWAFVAGVLSLAAQSPMRGSMLISDDEPVTPEDVAAEATIPLKDAKATLASLRRLGMLERDEHGIEWVHDWDKLNPDPKPSDSPVATRERKRRQRAKARGHADVTRDVTPRGARDIAKCHAPEVEEKKKNPPKAPQGGRTRDKTAYAEEVAEYAAYLLPDAKEPERTQMVVSALGWMRDRVNGDLADNHVLLWIRQHAPELITEEPAA
jgi:hypothetical protein